MIDAIYASGVLGRKFPLRFPDKKSVLIHLAKPLAPNQFLEVTISSYEKTYDYYLRSLCFRRNAPELLRIKVNNHDHDEHARRGRDHADYNAYNNNKGTRGRLLNSRPS